MRMGIMDAFITAVTGYAVVFFGIVLLIIVVALMGRAMTYGRSRAAVPAAPEPKTETVKAPPARGTGGDLMLYDTPPDVAAMIMAIVADKEGVPVNELRFISIKEIR